jgi:hypothetical protein
MSKQIYFEHPVCMSQITWFCNIQALVKECVIHQCNNLCCCSFFWTPLYVLFDRFAYLGMGFRKFSRKSEKKETRIIVYVEILLPIK